MTNRLVNEKEEEKLHKWNVLLGAAKRCLCPSMGSLAVLVNDEDIPTVFNILAKNLVMHVHHKYYFMTVPYR